MRVRPATIQMVQAAAERWGFEDEIMQGIASGDYLPVAIADDKELIGVATIWPYHPWKDVGFVVEHVRWHPKLSAIKTARGFEAFLKDVGSRSPLIGYARSHDYKFFDLMRRRGYLRKVGKQGLGFDKLVTVFETRKELLPTE